MSRQLQIYTLKQMREQYESAHMDTEAEALDAAIQKFEQPTDGDLISRQAAIDAMCELMHHWFGGDPKDEVREINRELGKLPSAQPEQRWIPIKTRPMTDEERDYWSEHYGYDIEYEDAVMFDCKMPEDKQPVWVQSKCGYIYEDVCENDDGMIGLEGNGDWNDIVAWMPKYVPEPWKGEEHG